ncbi:MAG: arginine--tRNA ligase, partial [bacterium]|nr:arginine--tRNA ligase [bacterium]
MFLELQNRIQQAISTHLAERHEITDVPVTIEKPRESGFGELATPVAFQLARKLRKAPKLIAQDLAGAMSSVEGIAAFEVAGNGYINVRFDRGYYARSLLSTDARPKPVAGKVIVEHTNINPNKAAHIGHIRNSVLGDTFVRMLRSTGRQVEVQNYIDNTGVQVADVVVGFQHLEGKKVAEVRALAEAPRFDYYCWDLYARTSSHYGEHPESRSWRQQTLHAIESGEGEVSELA